MERGRVRLDPRQTKTGEGRSIFLDTELREVFSNQWKRRNRSSKILPYVFLNPAGSGEVRDLRKSWSTACKKAGLGKRLFHDLRGELQCGT